MKPLKCFLLIIILIFIQTCKYTPEYFQTTNALPIDYSFQGKTILINSELSNPTRIENINDNYILVIDERQNGIFQVFRLPDLNFLYSWGNIGRGPNEFTSHYFSDQSLNIKKNQLILYDAANFGRLLFYTVTDTALVLTQQDSIFHENQLTPLNRLRRLNDSIYFADYQNYGIQEDSDYEFMALTPGKKELLFAFGQYPKTQLQGEDRYQKYKKLTASKPDGSKFVAFYLFQNMFKIYDNEGSILKKIEVKDEYLSNNILNYNDEFIYRGFVYASDDYIYVYAPYTTEEKAFEDPESYRPLIEIWDWEGQPIHRFILDKPVHEFTVSEKFKKIYAFTAFESQKIFEYDLAGIINSN